MPKQRCRSAARSINTQLMNFKPLAIFSGCTAQFVSDLVGHPEDRVSLNAANFSNKLNVMTNFLPMNVEERVESSGIKQVVTAYRHHRSFVDYERL